nr:uncharacterized protein LOC118680988 [Bactrocera oleae]
MDADAPMPTPAIRSAINVPRPGVTPAPRSVTATAPTAAPRSSARPSPTANREPQRVRCIICRRPHRLQHCNIFRGMQPMQRQQIAQAHGHCLNCLTAAHNTQECTSVNLCQICGRLHHTLLHRNPRRDIGRPPAPRSRPPSRQPLSTRAIQHRRPAAPPVSRLRSHRNEAPMMRRHSRPQYRRSTGLSNVVATLQQLQRLLG